MPTDAPITHDIGLTHSRNRLAGIWAAELLGLMGHAASDYAKSVIHPDHPPETLHDDDAEQVAHKLSKDLHGRVALGEIRERMAHFLAEAKRQIRG
jgi:hypothetical protein